jgi:hypothetical protein
MTVYSSTLRNKLHLLRRTEHRFIRIAPDMYATGFGPFLGQHHVVFGGVSVSYLVTQRDGF